VTEPTTQNPELIEDATAVQQMLQFLVKALRAVQLYLPNNPVYQRAMENLQRSFEPVWVRCAELEISVAETDLVWEGQEVLGQPSKSDSVAWVLYKDGVRSFSLSPGVEDGEIVKFLNVIHKVRTLPADAPDDLLTLLWEEDFQQIRYHAVDLAADDAPHIDREEGLEFGAAAATPEDVKQQVTQELAEEETSRGPATVSVEDFDSTLYFLDEKEIAYLKAEIEREYAQDLRVNVLSMLFDVLELQTYSTVRAELISILENFIPYLLAGSDFQSVAYILREIRTVLQRAREVLPEHRDSLQALPARLSEEDVLGQLLQSLDEAMAHPTEAELTELFRELRPEALEAILGWLPRLGNEQVRKLLDAAAIRLAQAHPQIIAEVLKTPDEGVLLEAIRVISHSKLPPAVPGLGALMDGASIQVKRAAVEALAGIATPGAMQQLERAVDDADRDVRIASVRAMAAQGHRAAFPQIESALSGKGLRGADLTEKTAFFEAYGTLAGEAGIGKLAPMLVPKGFFRRKADPQTRACAAMALGKIGTPEARKALNAATGDKEPLVRNAVAKALKEMP
jgi:hypothetical protein